MNKWTMPLLGLVAILAGFISLAFGVSYSCSEAYCGVNIDPLSLLFAVAAFLGGTFLIRRKSHR